MLRRNRSTLYLLCATKSQHTVLLVRENELDEGLTDSLKGVAVNVLHVIVDGMPRGSEATLFAIRIVINDIDTGDMSLLIDRQMVVSDSPTVF